MSADHLPDKIKDATVLLTGGHVDEMVSALRAVKVVTLRLESSNQKLVKSNDSVIASNNLMIAACHQLAKSNDRLANEIKRSRGKKKAKNGRR